AKAKQRVLFQIRA
ncbi:alkaline phosphatase family protein, partial [Vibrio parahaemolyticus V-223/04]